MTKMGNIVNKTHPVYGRAAKQTGSHLLVPVLTDAIGQNEGCVGGVTLVSLFALFVCLFVCLFIHLPLSLTMLPSSSTLKARFQGEI